MTRKESLKKQCRDLTLDFLPQKQPNQNGKRSKESVTERNRIAKRESKERCSSSSFQQQVLRLPLFLDLTLTCQQISVSFLSSHLNSLIIEIPRPYGVFAPFMPSEPGSAMRHIIKPKIREIEY
jgi:hypothetical protein